MTVHKVVLPMFLLSFLTVACEDKKASDTETTPAAPAAGEASKTASNDSAAIPPTASAPAAATAEAAQAVKEAVLPGPQDICSAIVEAAKAKDDSKILAASTPATATAFAADGVKDSIMGVLSTATCGTPVIDGDNATVTLGTVEPIKQATFSKAADGWKFDGAAFAAKYPVAVAKEKIKKAAAKVQHKASAHGKKHH